MDEFGDAVLSTPKGLVETAWTAVGGGTTTIASASTVFIALVFIALITRVLSTRSTPIRKGGINAVPILPYSFPFFKHAFSLLFSRSFLQSARDASHYGIFGIQAGPFTATVVTDPELVTAVVRQREASMQFMPFAWKIMRNVFGVGSGKKIAAQWQAAWPPLHSAVVNNMMTEPQLGKMVDRVIENMERAIPSMITFTDNPIDQKPWEKVANVSVYPSHVPEVYINLMELMRHLLGDVSLPALMGDRFLEKYPDTLTDLFTMDDGFMYMIFGASRFFPLPMVFRAYLARKKLLESFTDFNRALDLTVDGRNPGSDKPGWDWGDLDDVSDLVVKRAEIYREYGFTIEDRSDISIIWAFIANSTMLVYWHILYILSTPDLLPQILSEIAPHATPTAPITINGFSSAPSIKISAEGLSKSCPLFKSTYFETLRLVNQAASVRKVANDITISPSDTNTTSTPPTSFTFPKSSYVIMPYSLHATDPIYFPSPETFIPDRFIITSDNSSSHSSQTSLSTPSSPSKSSQDVPAPQTQTKKADPLTTRPYGGGPTICKGRLLAEKECLALVAGVLMMWEIEPADPKKGWKIPKMKRKSAISEPVVDTRVKIRRRVF